MKKLNLGLGFLILISTPSFGVTTIVPVSGSNPTLQAMASAAPALVPKIPGNPNLKACLNPVPLPTTYPDGTNITYTNGAPNLAPFASNPSYFTCQEVLPDTNTNHWNDYLTDSNGRQITGGLFTSKGVFCSDIHDGKTPDTNCNIEKRSRIVIKCPQDSRTQVINGARMCNTFATIAIYNSQIEKVVPKGSIPLKSVITGVNGGPPPVEIPIATFMSVKYGSVACTGANGVQGMVICRADDGSPVCDGGAMATNVNNALADATQALQQITDLKLCMTETANVQQNGGSTVHCSPNISNFHLTGGQHFTKDCTAAGGTIVNLDGTPATLPVATDFSTFCQFNSSSCSNFGSWNPMKDSSGNPWTTTSDGSNYTIHPGQDVDYCNIGTVEAGNGCGSPCITAANYGNPQHGPNGQDLYKLSTSHSWLTIPHPPQPESQNYQYNWAHNPTADHSRCQSCDLDGNVHTCTAVITAVGCW